MDVKNKRGQTTNIVGKVLGFLFVIFFMMVFIFTIMNLSNGNDFKETITGAFGDTGNIFKNIFGPIFNVLLGTDGVGGDYTSNWMILAFIAVAIVVIGTLDSIDIFGEGTQAGWMNFAIGIITAIIGVRFMPQDVWMSLTIPFIVFIVGFPFGALFFLSMKATRSRFMRSFLWIVYAILMGYLFFRLGDIDGGFKVVYLIFLFLAIIMVFFNGSIMKFFDLKEDKAEAAKMKGRENSLKIKKYKKELTIMNKIVGESDSPKEDVRLAKRVKGKLKSSIKDESSDY